LISGQEAAMRILVVGATGTIGRAIVRALEGQHEIIQATRHTAGVQVDITNQGSIQGLFARIGAVDALVGVAGEAAFRPLAEMSDADFQYSLQNKLMGQVNLVRFGLAHVKDGGCITLTSGVLARLPMPCSTAVSLVNAGIEAFARAAALEAPRGIRVNAVSPPWVTDTLIKLGMDPGIGLTPEKVAALYVRSLTGGQTGTVIEVD
jgi:NAD(P)-dependent dehydrogenase (short-subunit alcohol dehydrogenase family)